jgi:uncharacterized membrane protein YdbT with pleckstrin-like domain
MLGSKSWAGPESYASAVPFSRKLLNDDEDIALDLHPHWEFFLKPGAALVVALALGVLVAGWGDAPGWIEAVVGVLVLVALAWCGLTYARWATTHFVVTTDRLIYRHGVLAKHGIEIPLERVNTVFFSQSILERMVGSGDLVIESAGEMGRQSFSNVRKPSAVQNEIYRQMEQNENRKFDRINARPAEAVVGVPEQIQQLDALRQQGVLTDAEFQAKKADLLRRM